MGISMSENKVLLNAWLSRYWRENFIEIYEKMKDKYSQTINLVFKDINQTTNEYRDKLTEEYGHAFNWEVTDPADIYEDIMDKSISFYEYEELMKHNFHMSFLSTMYQIFEQQLRSFIYRELKHGSNGVDPGEYKDFCANISEIKEAYSYFNYSLYESEHWDRIQQLSDLANAFKHGAGRSSKRLQKKHPEVLAKTPMYHDVVMDQELTTNSEIAFDLEEIDFSTFADILIAFWTDFPEHLNGSYTFKK